MGDNNLDDMNGFNGFEIGSGYEISLGDQLVKPRTHSFNSTDVIRIGDSCVPPTDLVVVQIIIYSGYSATDMTWDLFEVNDPSTNLLSGSVPDDSTGSYHEIFVHPNSCLIFRMQNSMDASFTIMWDGKVIYEGHREFHPIPLIRFGSCSQCAQGSKLFQATAQFLGQGVGGFWELLDSNGDRLQRDDSNPAPYFEDCVRDQCLSLRMGGDATVTYQLFWDGDLLKFSTPNFIEVSTFGTCNDCSNGLSFFELMINTGRYMNKASWSVGTKNQTNAIFQRRLNDNDKTVPLKNLYFAKCVNVTNCLYVNINSVCHGDMCIKFRLRRDMKILNDITLNTTLAKITNKKIDSADSICTDDR